MNALNTLPAGVEEALGLVDHLDEALLQGFARLAEDQRPGLDAFAAVFTGTPLGSAIGEAVAGLGRSEFLPRSFLALASGRAALLGAIHDALIAQVRETLGRPPMVDLPHNEPPILPGHLAPALASVQHWLTELAIAGLKQLEESTIAPFAATLGLLQDHPETTGLATLLDGFSTELIRSIPAAKRDVPAFRWGDLWSSAMIRTQQVPPSPSFRPIQGTFTPLGLDTQSHEHFICAVVYGVVDDGNEPQTARLPLTSYKVDVITEAEVWDLFGSVADPVLAALADHRSLRFERGELRSNGDLILQTDLEVGDRADPFALADRWTSLPSPPPLYRHPVHIAELVRLAGNHGLPLALERLPTGSELTAEAVAAAPELIGLLRFDRGGWRVQPLCLRTRRGMILSGEEIQGQRKKLKNRSLETLRERAGRLLRARS